MTKLLLGSVVVIGLGAVSSPASSQELKLGVGGHFKGYAVMHDQDTATGSEKRSFDILRETEIHFSGATTLVKGLTVGVHTEADTDDGVSFNEDETLSDFNPTRESGKAGRRPFLFVWNILAPKCALCL